jgi:hypothetical protein
VSDTVEQLLDAVLNVRSPAEFKVRVDAALRAAFQDVGDAAWRNALETFARVLEKGLQVAHGSGIPPQRAAVNLTEIIMAAREHAKHPPQLREPSRT